MTCSHLQDDGRCGLGKFQGTPRPIDCRVCLDYSGPPRGLGDAVHGLLDDLGVVDRVRLRAESTGRPCRCGERRDKLNRLMPFGDR